MIIDFFDYWLCYNRFTFLPFWFLIAKMERRQVPFLALPVSFRKRSGLTKGRCFTRTHTVFHLSIRYRISRIIMNFEFCIKIKWKVWNISSDRIAIRMNGKYYFIIYELYLKNLKVWFYQLQTYNNVFYTGKDIVRLKIVEVETHCLLWFGLALIILFFRLTPIKPYLHENIFNKVLNFKWHMLYCEFLFVSRITFFFSNVSSGWKPHT